jgi:hypothetical protein
MRVDNEAVKQHATAVSQARFAAVRPRLRTLSPDEKSAVEEIARAIGQGVAGCLLEKAASDQRLAAVLAALYPAGGETRVGTRIDT